MPDGTNYKPDFTTFTTAEKLRYLADFMEGLRPEQVDMRTFHSDCGTAHCAAGWAEVIGLYPKFLDALIDLEKQVGICRMWHCYDDGIQFNYLDRPYQLADVVRHLREVADEVARDGKS